MKRLKILASLLVVVSVVAINTKQASATDCWKQDSNGWWLQEGSSYVKNSWRLVNGQWYYFDSTGYMKMGWVQYNGKWYYLNSDGKMLSNTTINGYALGADGAWVQSQQENGVWQAPEGFYNSSNNRDTDGCIGGTAGNDPETAERMARENSSTPVQNNKEEKVNVQDAEQDSGGVWQAPEGFYDHGDEGSFDPTKHHAELGESGNDPETAERMARENQ